MIRIKRLINEIHDVETITPKDIYNFYYLWHIAVNDPSLVQTPFGKETQDYYLKQLKEKYVRLFTKLLTKQIHKYVQRGRIDPDFPKDVDVLNMADTAKLLELMKKTFRSDMTRRNDRWILVAEYTQNLAKSNTAKQMYLWIDRLNNSVHNTQTRVMDKFQNYYTELNKAFDIVFHANSIRELRHLVDKDLRDLSDQGEAGHPDELTTESNTVKIKRSDRENEEFMLGLKVGVQDKASGTKRDLTGFSNDFVRGYKTVPKEKWWDKFNDKLTQWAADFGHSYGKRF